MARPTNHRPSESHGLSCCLLARQVNNYASAHGRQMAYMALSIDPADDPVIDPFLSEVSDESSGCGPCMCSMRLRTHGCKLREGQGVGEDWGLGDGTWWFHAFAGLRLTALRAPPLTVACPSRTPHPVPHIPYPVPYPAPHIPPTPVSKPRHPPIAPCPPAVLHRQHAALLHLRRDGCGSTPGRGGGGKGMRCAGRWRLAGGEAGPPCLSTVFRRGGARRGRHATAHSP